MANTGVGEYIQRLLRGAAGIGELELYVDVVLPKMNVCGLEWARASSCRCLQKKVKGTMETLCRIRGRVVLEDNQQGSAVTAGPIALFHLMVTTRHSCRSQLANAQTFCVH